jgi:hypothetical protein
MALVLQISVYTNAAIGAYSNGHTMTICCSSWNGKQTCHSGVLTIPQRICVGPKSQKISATT